KANRWLAGTQPPPSACGSRAVSWPGSFVLQFVEQIELPVHLGLVAAPDAPGEGAGVAVVGSHRSERRVGRRGTGAPRVRLLLWWAGVVTRHNANLPSRHTNSRPSLA